jgi:hypothetical protein
LEGKKMYSEMRIAANSFATHVVHRLLHGNRYIGFMFWKDDAGKEIIVIFSHST